MLVKGNSGFGIELVNELTIRKSAFGPGASRLKRQIEKQTHFQTHLQYDKVQTAQIYRMIHDADTFYADMEFVSAKDFIQFLSEADRQDLDAFLEVIINFIQRNLANSINRDVTTPVLEKLVELEGKGIPEHYLEVARGLCGQPVHVPVGPCHGDLTLSNILFKGERLFLLDFLDSYVESPLQDIVKLRQDTQYGWSLLLYRAEFDRAKIQIALRYIDRHIAAKFLLIDWCRSHYDLFQLVNLMRVLPYCSDGKTAAHIGSSIDRLIAGIPVNQWGAA